VFFGVGTVANSKITIYSHNDYWNESKINDIFDELHYILFTYSTVNSLTSIASNEFEDVGKLKTIDLANTIDSIGEGAFRNSGLTSIEIPSGVTIIRDNTFKDCTHLESVTFEEISSLTTINPFAFQNSGLTSITIPDTITSILGGAFYNTNLTSITIPNTITQLQDDTFRDCTDLTQVTFEANSLLETIGNDVFRNTDLTSITIPNSVTSIGARAFQGLSNLESFTLPSNSEFVSIPESLFADSIGNLTGGSIPLSVTSIGLNAFTSTVAPAVGVMLRVPRFVLDWNTTEQGYRFHSNFILHYNHFDNYFYKNGDIVAHYEPDTNSDKYLEFTEYKNRGNGLKYFSKGILIDASYNYTNGNDYSDYPHAVVGPIGYKITNIDIGTRIAPYYTIYTVDNNTATKIYSNVPLIPGWTKLGIFAVGGGGGGGGGGWAYSSSGGWQGGRMGAGSGGSSGGVGFVLYNRDQLPNTTTLQIQVGKGGAGGQNWNQILSGKWDRCGLKGELGDHSWVKVEDGDDPTDPLITAYRGGSGSGGWIGWNSARGTAAIIDSGIGTSGPGNNEYQQAYSKNSSSTIRYRAKDPTVRGHDTNGDSTAPYHGSAPTPNPAFTYRTSASTYTVGNGNNGTGTRDLAEDYPLSWSSNTAGGTITHNLNILDTSYGAGGMGGKEGNQGNEGGNDGTAGVVVVIQYFSSINPV